MEKPAQKTVWGRLFVWSLRILIWGFVVGGLCRLVLGREPTLADAGAAWPVLVALCALYLACGGYLLMYLARTEGKKSLKDKEVRSFRLIRKRER